MLTQYANGLTYDQHLLYNFKDSFVTRTYFTISNENDTTFRSIPDKALYITQPVEKKIYRYTDLEYNYAYTFKNGNLFKFGEFKVIENDTIDTFFGEYHYDNQPNTFFIPKYKATIPHEFYHSFVTSKNNLISVVHYDNYNAGQRWNYYFNYDSQNNLKRYKGKSGLLVDFDYSCN